MEAPQPQSAIIVARGFGMKRRLGYKGYVIEARSHELSVSGRGEIGHSSLSVLRHASPAPELAYADDA